ncbi:RluA family pseudouridine synthase [Candidatus Phytoplasma luffae]|uniref:Pseudouridine synthase n=1 Tax=Loofah witches'-broom phytoplasma TaxID=35773 RepID=A0A975ILW6_LOWBP|nr:RluA family pseudouridine synthase [Candidatus Phytoplasma luffae]QTX02768.1 RluA family pseudouridine synthase [Candidatus Phytoplasma luffae]
MIKEFVVEKKNRNLRLDFFLAKQFNISRNICHSFINSNKVLVNDKVVKKSHLLKENDVIKTPIIEKNSISNIFEPINLNLDIVYEDNYLLIINKPYDLIVHPSLSYSGVTLINGLRYQIKDFLCSHPLRPGIIHRLDKNTTGLIIVGKTNEVVERMQNLIRQRKIQRIYWSLVYGFLGHEYGTIDIPIKRSISDYYKMTVSKEGKRAITHFKTLEKFKDISLLELKLETGRTHQIRVHLSYLKHPIVGDTLYGRENQLLNKQLLHAKKINFIHPFTDENLEFEIPLPIHFQEFLKKLKSE